MPLSYSHSQKYSLVAYRASNDLVVPASVPVNNCPRSHPVRAGRDAGATVSCYYRCLDTLRTFEYRSRTPTLGNLEQCYIKRRYYSFVKGGQPTPSAKTCRASFEALSIAT
jgi:hypothetical protein